MSALQAKMQMVIYVKQIAQPVGVLALALAMAVCVGSAQSKAAADHERQTAIAYEQQGQFTEAEAAWRAVLKAHPADAEAYAHLGLLEARQEHYKEAVPLYRKALDTESVDARLEDEPRAFAVQVRRAQGCGRHVYATA